MSTNESLHASTEDAAHADGAGSALRLFDPANGMNDFPVLKAFQERLAEEQAHARKRMLWLAVFFVSVLVAVVVAFSFVMASVISRDQQSLSAIATRNQELSDKLLDIALRERAPAAQPVVNVQQPAPQQAAESTGAVLKPVLDRLEMIAANLKPAPQPAPVVQPAPVAQPASVASPALDAARREQDALQRQREAVAAERARLRAEQEQLRQDRIEQHRRRLYPEYYAQKDAEAAAALPPPAPAPIAKPVPVVSGTPVSKPVPKAEPAPKPTAKPAPAPIVQSVPKATPKPVSIKKTEAISYFDEEDDAPAAKPESKPAAKPESKPAAKSEAKPAAKPESKPTTPKPVAKPAETPALAKPTETLNVGTKDGTAIPWLIELPESK